MKRFIVLIMALLFTTAIGCDGDGSEVPPPAPGHVPGTGTGGGILASGSKTVPAGTQLFLTSFSVSETGTLEGRLTWSGEPDEMSMYIFHVGSSTSFDTLGSSPLYRNIEVTQAMLNQGENFNFAVGNPGVDPVEVEYRIIFRPN